MNLTIQEIESIANATINGSYISRTDILRLANITRDYVLMMDHITALRVRTEEALIRAANATENMNLDVVQRRSLDKENQKLKVRVRAMNDQLDRSKQQSEIIENLAMQIDMIKEAAIKYMGETEDHLWDYTNGLSKQMKDTGVYADLDRLIHPETEQRPSDER